MRAPRHWVGCDTNITAGDLGLGRLTPAPLYSHLSPPRGSRVGKLPKQDHLHRAVFLLRSTPCNVFPESSWTASQVSKICGPGKGLVLQCHSLPLPPRQRESKSHRERTGVQALLPQPCCWTWASRCACPQTQALPHGVDGEAAVLMKVGCLTEGSNLPLTGSSAAQRISCYF